MLAKHLLNLLWCEGEAHRLYILHHVIDLSLIYL